MKEELYKYLSIGLLALLLLVFFGSLITYFVVGQESVKNTAFALDNQGYYEDNFIPHSDFTSWTGTITRSNSSIDSSTLLFEDGDFSCYLYGYGTLTNNYMVADSGQDFALRFVLRSLNRVPSTFGYFTCVFGFGSNTRSVFTFVCNQSTNSTPVTSTYSYSMFTKQTYMVTGDYIDIKISNGDSVTLQYLYLAYARYFRGYVGNSYYSNGYNVGFTDGVNSASGGSITGVTDLTGLSWEVPDVTSTASVSHQYNVTGSVGDFNFDILGMLDYGANLPILDNDSSLSKPFILIDFNPLTQRFTPYYIKPGDIITFTGGEDVTNTDLIQWLEDNNAFKTYTEGYQDGYNSGYDIGYSGGYSDAQEQAQLTLSGTYNLVGSIKTLGNINSYTFNGSTYVAYSGETDSFTDNSSVTYYANYYDTQGDDGVLLGYCVDYLFRYSVKVRTIVYGTSSRWNQVGFNIIAINTQDNSYFTLTRDDTSYFKEYGSLGADNTNGTYISCEFDFEFPSPDEYRLMFVPISHNVSEDTDNATMLVFEDTYFLAQGSGSMSYDDYNYLISDAYNRGMNTGRSNGYDSGREVGYNIGYTKGVEDAGEYTFNGLLGAVFDAPITMFIGKYNSETGLREGGLLNFNLLGVNLGTFVLALLSLGLVLFILRLFIRGL